MSEIILASTSPRRKELLAQLKAGFRIVPSDATEVLDHQLTGREAAQINAYRKARAVAKRFPDAIVIGADTVVYLDSRLFGKPADLSEAHLMLDQLQGRTHHVVTGVCLIHLRERRQRMFADTTEVTFRSLTYDQIESYLSSIDPLDKAGGYAIQQGGDVIIKEISGSYSNVVGLPLERLQEEFEIWHSVNTAQ